MEKKEEKDSCLELSKISLVWLAVLVLAGLFTALTVLMINIEKDNELIIKSLLPLSKKASENQRLQEFKNVQPESDDFGSENFDRSVTRSNEYVTKGDDIQEPDVDKSAEKTRDEVKSFDGEAVKLREVVEKLREEAEKIRDDFEKPIFEARELRDEAEMSRVDAEKIADQFEKPEDQAENSGDDAQYSQDEDDVVEDVLLDCAHGFTRIADVCYGVFNKWKMSWYDAKRSCMAKGGFLAEPKSFQENKNIVDLVKANGIGNAWIGATDKVREGHWTWAHSGTNVTYTPWLDGEPNNNGGGEDCVHLSTYAAHIKAHNYGWNDAPCGWAHYFVCQM